MAPDFEIFCKIEIKRMISFFLPDVRLSATGTPELRIAAPDGLGMTLTQKCPRTLCGDSDSVSRTCMEIDEGKDSGGPTLWNSGLRDHAHDVGIAFFPESRITS